MNTDFSREDTAYREALRVFLDEELPEDWQSMFVGRDTWKWTKQFCSALADRGWLTPSWPGEFGGGDGSVWRELVTQEEMWAHNEPRGPQYMNINWIGPAIMRFGTLDQENFFLPRMAQGEIIWGQGFSEPEAGSDLAGLQTRARLEGDHFIVNGHKTWTSYGDIADYYFLLCRTQPGSERRAGLSVLLVDLTAEGVTVRELPTVLGDHRQAEVFFDDARIPETALLGPLHQGWEVATSALSFERIGIPQYARAVRVLARLEAETADGWDPSQTVVFASSLAFARVAELCTYVATADKASGAPARAPASVARIHNALLERRVADTSELLAGSGLVAVGGSDPHTAAGGEIETHWRNSPTVTVAAGSLEIQKEILARDALNLPT